MPRGQILGSVDASDGCGARLGRDRSGLATATSLTCGPALGCRELGPIAGRVVGVYSSGSEVTTAGDAPLRAYPRDASRCAGELRGRTDQGDRCRAALTAAYSVSNGTGFCNTV